MPRIIDLRDFCRDHREWLLDTIEALVALESPTTDKAAVDRCGADWQTRLEAIGGRVTRLPRERRGDHLLAEFGCGSVAGAAARPFRHRVAGRPARPHAADRARRPAAWPGRLRHESGHRDRACWRRVPCSRREPAGSTGIVMLWTTDEEVGSETSRAAIEDEARRSGAVLVLEPSLPGGAVKTVAQRLRQLRARRARGRRARRHRAAEGRQRHSGARASDLARQRAAGSGARHLGQRRQVSGGTPGERRSPTRRARSSMCACRRLAAAARSTRRSAACAGRSPHADRDLAAAFDRPPLERTAARGASV